LKGELERKTVVDAAAGEEHTIVVAQIIRDGKPISELVYGCGNNLKGQLGINRTSHLNDFTLVEDISELFDSMDEQQSPLLINKISCGRRHCMASFGYGAFVFWGDNESGQLGNKKRSFIESPFPKPKFEFHHNVENVILGDSSSAVIVEALPPRKKKKKKTKRVITLEEVRDSEMLLKAENERRMAELSHREADQQKEVTARMPLSERMRGKFFGALYGNSPVREEKLPEEKK
jgi:alpha-tubulin suppressor-like RCC1 family protein